MKYVYIKNRITLDVARHEVTSDKFAYLQELLRREDSSLEEICYHEYRAIVNAKIQAQREILNQEYTRYKKAHYEAMKELRAKELPIDEVTE